MCPTVSGKSSIICVSNRWQAIKTHAGDSRPFDQSHLLQDTLQAHTIEMLHR